MRLGRIIVFAPFLIIKSPKRSGETYFCFGSSSYNYYSCFPFFLLLFLSAQILSRQFLSNHRTDCPEILGYGRYGCEVVQKGFKMSDSKAGPWACPKPPKFCSDYFSRITEGIVLKTIDMIDIDI